MTHKRLVLLLVIALMTAGVLAAVALGSRDPAPPPAVEARLQETVVRYVVEQEPVVPEKFYGKTLTIGRCVTLLKTHVERLTEVATSSGIYPVDTGWLYLAGIRGQIRELQGALPIDWSGRVVYWDVTEGGGDTYTVRAAVQTTLTSAYWDEESERLVGPKEFTYSSAAADEYTLRKVGDTWKVAGVKRWKFYDVPGGLTTAP